MRSFVAFYCLVTVLLPSPAEMQFASPTVEHSKDGIGLVFKIQFGPKDARGSHTLVLADAAQNFAFDAALVDNIDNIWEVQVDDALSDVDEEEHCVQWKAILKEHDKVVASHNFCFFMEPERQLAGVSSNPLVLAYGDSLTTGLVETGTYAPYAPFLESAIHAAGFPEAQVAYDGIDNFKAKAMLDFADFPTGLRSVIQNHQPVAAMILLAGSFDLSGYCYWPQITDSVIALHEICYTTNVPYTIVVGIPQSKFQVENPWFLQSAENLNQELEEWAATEERATYFSFPFLYNGAGDPNYASDGTHLSELGYQVLGESLAPVVQSLLFADTLPETPAASPTTTPTMEEPTPMPSQDVDPTSVPTKDPTQGPTARPTNEPTSEPTDSTTLAPTLVVIDTTTTTSSTTTISTTETEPATDTTTGPAGGTMVDHTAPVFVLSYGDSLTSGLAESNVYVPYGVFLEDILQDKYANLQVIHIGNDSWKAKALLDFAPYPTGLRNRLTLQYDPSFAIVILLAGTFDLNNYCWWESITDSILGLHEVCYDEGIQHTIAVGIPQSQFQIDNPYFLQSAASVNQELEEWATQDSRTVFLPFPFPYNGAGDPNFATDGTHLSALGYEKLAIALAPVVDAILMENDSLFDVPTLPPTEYIDISPSSTPFHIYAYGDSLTVGQVENSAGPYTPYAPFLQATLQSTYFSNAVVFHNGLSGLTSQALLDAAYGADGLATDIISITNPAVSVVILLAGTNDLWTRSASEIETSVQALHNVCYSENVHHTIAVEIPQSNWQLSDPSIVAKAIQANEGIRNWAESEPRATWFPFPFDYNGYSDPNFASDGLHLSPLGYQTLGESLAPVVSRILASLEL